MAGAPDALIQQIEATHAGEPWYGSSAERLLRGITAEQARLTPVPGGHSIWQQVLHMISWKREVTRRIQGSPPKPPIEGDWPSVGDTERDWASAREALGQANRDLLAAVATQPASRWDQPIGDTHDPSLGSGLSVLGMLVGISQHDAYHIGQIAMLRRATGLL